MKYLRLLPATWRLRFPRHVEQDFVQHYEVNSLRTIQVSLAFGFLLYSSFGLLDLYSAPLSTTQAWLYRFGIGSPTLLLIVIVTHLKSFRPYLQQIISAGCVVAGSTVCLIIWSTEPRELAHNHYYVGLIIIMMFTGSWARLRFWYALFSNSVIIVVYFIVLLTDQDMLHDELLIVNNSVFLLSAHCVAALTCYFFEVNSRIEFLQHRTIEAETARSDAQRRKLEQQARQLEQALTSLEAAQAQLVQREKMASLGELTAGIAHEIQNPLNFVNNFAEVSVELATELEEEASRPQPDAQTLHEAATELRQNQERIHLHGKRAANIVRDMLSHARASSGERVPTDLNSLAAEHLHLAYSSVRARHPGFTATLITDLDPDQGLLPVIPEALSRVLLNLFTNAFYALQQRLKAGPIGYLPELQVSTRRGPEHAELRVRDNGLGIPAAIQAKIFQPFFTTKPPGEGTGLGLSLSYDIISNGHGGALSVRSEEGQYTEFIITLPLVVVVEKSPPAPALTSSEMLAPKVAANGEAAGLLA